MPSDTNTKSGRPMIDVLWKKHPPMMNPNFGIEGKLVFQRHNECPAAMPVDCGQDIVMVMEGELAGGIGPSSVDSSVLGE